MPVDAIDGAAQADGGLAVAGGELELEGLLEGDRVGGARELAL